MLHILNRRRCLASQEPGLDTIWPTFEDPNEKRMLSWLPSLPSNAFTTFPVLLPVVGLMAGFEYRKVLRHQSMLQCLSLHVIHSPWLVACFRHVAFAMMVPASIGCVDRVLLHVGMQLDQTAGQLLARLLEVCLAHEGLASLHGLLPLVHSGVHDLNKASDMPLY